MGIAGASALIAGVVPAAVSAGAAPATTGRVALADSVSALTRTGRDLGRADGVGTVDFQVV